MPSYQTVKAGGACVEISADRTKLDAALTSAQKKLTAFYDSWTAKAAGAAAKLSASVLGGGAVASSIFKGFDDQARIVKAVTGATGDEFDRLTEKAKELGRTTAFTAAQVAEGMAGLGRAGFKAPEIEESIAAVMALSSATATELATATDIAGAALRGFGLDASDMARVCDVLTATANGSAQTLEDLGESFKVVAPTAATTGMTLEDAAKLLGALANFGIKGSNAGTAFKNMRVRMVDPSVVKKYRELGVATTDADGNLRGLADVLRDLGDAVSSLPNAEKLDVFRELFGMYGLAGGSVLTGAQFDDLFKAIDNASGAAARTAQEMESGLGGSFRAAQSAAEGLAVAIGETLAPTAQELLNRAVKAAGALSGWVKANQGVVVSAAKAAAAVGAVGAAILGASKAAKAFSFVLDGVRGASKLCAAATGKLAGSVKGFVAAERVRAAAAATSKVATEAATAAAVKHAAVMASVKLAAVGLAAAFAAVAAAAVLANQASARAVDRAKERTRLAEEQSASAARLRDDDRALFDELKELEGQQSLTNEEFARAQNVVAALSKRYGDLGISVDEAARKIEGAAAAQQEFDKRQRAAQRKDLEAQITALQNENAAIKKRVETMTADGGMAGYRARMTANAKALGSFFGGETAEEEVGRLGDEQIANLKKIAALRDQIAALDNLEVGIEKDAQEDKKNPRAAYDATGETLASFFEFDGLDAARKKLKDARVNFENWRDAIDVRNKFDPTRLGREDDEKKLEEYRRAFVEQPELALDRERREEERRQEIADVEVKLYGADDKDRDKIVDALNELKKKQADARVSEAAERLSDALEWVRDAGEYDRDAAAQELAAAQEAARAAFDEQARLKENLLPEPEQIESSGSFDAFEAFDLSIDWNRAELEKQTAEINKIAATVREFKRAFDAANVEDLSIVDL